MTRRLVVRPRIHRFVAASAVFTVGSIALLYQATHGSPQARAFVLVLAALSLGCAGIAATMIVRRPARELVITDKAIILANVAIRFDEVKIIADSQTDDQTRPVAVKLVVYSTSQSLTIEKDHLPHGAYEEVVALVKARVTELTGS